MNFKTPAFVFLTTLGACSGLKQPSQTAVDTSLVAPSEHYTAIFDEPALNGYNIRKSAPRTDTPERTITYMRTDAADGETVLVLNAWKKPGCDSITPQDVRLFTYSHDQSEAGPKKVFKFDGRLLTGHTAAPIRDATNQPLFEVTEIHTTNRADITRAKGEIENKVWNNLPFFHVP